MVTYSCYKIVHWVIQVTLHVILRYELARALPTAAQALAKYLPRLRARIARLGFFLAQIFASGGNGVSSGPSNIPFAAGPIKSPRFKTIRMALSCFSPRIPIAVGEGQRYAEHPKE